MAQLLQTPSLPTSVPKAKAFANQVGGIALFGLAVVLGIGLLNVAKPYIARVPVVGSLMGASPASQPTGLFAGLGA